MTNGEDRWRGKIEAEVKALKEQVDQQITMRTELTHQYDKRLDQMSDRIATLNEQVQNLIGRGLVLGVIGTLIIAGLISFLFNHIG